MKVATTSRQKIDDQMSAKKEKPQQVRQSNIDSAKALGDAIRTSLGPKGMDKMIIGANKNVTITNDGATILKEMKATHPIAQMLSNMSQAQDVEAGDGTTTVVIYAAALLQAAEELLSKNIHPTRISEGFKVATEHALKVLEKIAIPVNLDDRDSLVKNAITSLSSKIVSQYAVFLAPLSVSAVLHVYEELSNASSVDLKNIRVVKKLGGTIDDTELITDGIVLTQKVSSVGNKTIKRVEKAKIGLIQFCLSPPKTDMENNIIVSDYAQMDRVLRDQRIYIYNLCKTIQKAGTNVLLVQKSILRDSLTEIALQFLNNMQIMVIDDIERNEIEFISKTLGCRPVASADHYNADILGSADIVEEISTGFDKYIRITKADKPIKTATILVRASNQLVLEEVARSIHDALCVVRSIVKSKNMLPGGGAPEVEMCLQLEQLAHTFSGFNDMCVRSFARALELVPITLIESSGLNAVDIITEIRKRHADGESSIGFNVKKGLIRNMVDDDVVQPLLVTTSAIQLASECVRCILKIDDILQAIR